jgi:uncharacterized protein YcfJ
MEHAMHDDRRLFLAATGPGGRRRTSAQVLALVMLAAVALTSCESFGDNPKTALGGLGGATVGGLIAAAAGGGGAGIAAGVIGGALLGGLVGNMLANALFKDFEAADLDRDGSLTFEEIEIYVRANRR